MNRNLKAYFAEKGWKPARIVKALKLKHPSSVSNWNTAGRVPEKHIPHLAALFKCEEDEIRNWSEYLMKHGKGFMNEGVVEYRERPQVHLEALGVNVLQGLLAEFNRVQQSAIGAQRLNALESMRAVTLELERRERQGEVNLGNAVAVAEVVAAEVEDRAKGSKRPGEVEPRGGAGQGTKSGKAG